MTRALCLILLTCSLLHAQEEGAPDLEALIERLDPRQHEGKLEAVQARRAEHQRPGHTVAQLIPALSGNQLLKLSRRRRIWVATDPGSRRRNELLVVHAGSLPRPRRPEASAPL